MRDKLKYWLACWFNTHAAVLKASEKDYAYSDPNAHKQVIAGFDLDLLARDLELLIAKMGATNDFPTDLPR